MLVELLREPLVLKIIQQLPSYFQLASGRVVEFDKVSALGNRRNRYFSKVQAGNLSRVKLVQAALATKRVAKNMKKEGCDRPSAISQAQWDES